MTVVVDPSSRLTLVTVVSEVAVCDVVEVVVETFAPPLGTTIVVVDCGPSGAVGDV
jgi:hypothetical protein